ncbi:MAG: glycosyltransferase [Actinobacteria bacterium]|nr:glycosyltransferase [Actinomycetota bacterium]
MDINICWHSTFSRPHGYAMISRALVLALEDAGVGVSYEYLYGPDTVFPVGEDEVLDDDRLNTIKRREPRRDFPHVIFGQGDAFEYVKRGVMKPRYRVGYTMLEVSGLPREWVRQANTMDEVWTPSPFNAWTFKSSGVSKPICIMPLGVDTDHFNPGIQGYPLEDVFTFLSIFEWGERKAPETLLTAFNQAFQRDEPVVLICKYDNYDSAVDVTAQIDALGLDPDGGRVVFIENQRVPYGELARLYRSADCFVLPTRGEGWGMPVLEAMACGVPAIATYWSAQQAFMTDANSYPLQVGALIDAKAKCPYYEGFKWAEPDIGHLRRLLRHVYENPGEGRIKGEQAARDVRGKWSLSLCEKRIRGRLEEIAGERSEKRKPSFSTWLPRGEFKPRIGFDISRGVGGDITGVGRSSLALVKGLAGLSEHENPFEYLLLPGFGDFVHPLYLRDYSFEGIDDKRFTLYRGPLPAFGSPDHYVPGLDLVHSTAYMRPETMGVPLVITVHDLTFITHPQYHTRENVQFCEDNMRRALDSGCQFIAVSENTKNDMLKHYGVGPDRVSVVYNAVDPGEFRQIPVRERQGILEKYDLPERFFVSVGSLEPRKNLRTVIQAMRIYKGQEQLVIAGHAGWKNEELYAAVENNRQRIKLIGYVPQDELPALYNAALATVYPSLYEGFGLPVLESMACGTPVITSNNSSIPEVAGNACILLEDPTDPEAVSEAMAGLAGDEGRRRRLSEEGLKQAARFSPDAAAGSAVGVYAGLLGVTQNLTGGNR